jgi:hypothetical protein
MTRVSVGYRPPHPARLESVAVIAKTATTTTCVSVDAATAPRPIM